jgi:putative CocE/NonD family hydrolase
MKTFMFGVTVVAVSLTSVLAQESEYKKIGRYNTRAERSVMVPMRDGVNLSTDLYLPDGATDKLPVVLVRTPYGKNNAFSSDVLLTTLVGRGYVVAIQDMRGRYESEGRYRAAMDNRNDGYDTVTWLTQQPWSSQKVGTAGCSYLGEVQLALAAERHSHHVTAVPMAAAAGYYAEGRPWVSFDGGAFELAQTAGWFADSGSQVFYGPPPWVDRQDWFRSDAAKLYRSTPERDLAKYYSLVSSLPTVDILEKAGLAPTDYRDFASNSPESEYFRGLEWVREADSFDVPALFVDSWYDYGVAETLQLFNLFQKNSASEESRNNQFVIIAPSTHCGYSNATEQTMVGERDLGDARLDLLDIQLRWYDFWLKGIDNGVTDMPKVQYYLMGKNEWTSAGAWPVPGTRHQQLYLRSGGRANSRYGDGILSTEPPGEEPADRFVYDPTTPVPSLGGQSCCTGTDKEAGGYDQSENEMRHDILVYTSPVLEEGVEVTGRLEVVLHVSSSARDTDFTAKLVDVYPDGRTFNIQEGALRMRYREGYSKKLVMSPDEIYQVRLDLHATSNYFGPGHRIRLEVSSSNFPRWDRNLNTGGNNYDETAWEVAVNTVHHSNQHPSYVVLPVIE